LTPAEPGRLVYTATFTPGSADIRYAEFTVTVKSIVPEPTDEFLDKVYVNEIEVGPLNDCGCGVFLFVLNQFPTPLLCDRKLPGTGRICRELYFSGSGEVLKRN